MYRLHVGVWLGTVGPSALNVGFSHSGLPAFIGISLTLLLVGWFSLAEACRVEEPAKPSPRVLHKHIVDSCTFEERSALALSAEEVLTALGKGHSVDLLGVVVKGDLSFDRLPLLPIQQQPISSSRIKEKFKERGLEEVRVIPGAMIIRESWFQGLIATNLRDGALVIFGPVDMDKTKFEKSLDFSKTVFLDPVNFSGTTIAYEGFFIGAHFDNTANFRNTVFGTHTRFHKALFGETAIFNHAGFHGLAEFLEVEFAGKADFSQTFFKHGTGFSGTQFRGASDFSQALFEREAYFRFATFEQNASFRGTRFKAVADFTNAQFNENFDFANAVFEGTPKVEGSEKIFKKQQVENIARPTSQIAIFVGLFLLVLVFVWRLRRK
ncbi:MAG: pentapeptide repeat-containing protein [Nitrospirota bacterium]|nr:MAG: pentapeptide repeat-containing protein [Nitrospirota bacterium]